MSILISSFAVYPKLFLDVDSWKMLANDLSYFCQLHYTSSGSRLSLLFCDLMRTTSQLGKKMENDVRMVRGLTI